MDQLRRLAGRAGAASEFPPLVGTTLERAIALVGRWARRTVERFVESPGAPDVELRAFPVAGLKRTRAEGFHGFSERRELAAIVRSLQRYRHLFVAVLLDGSVGSRDYRSGWSDVDAFIVPKNEVLEDPALLVELRRFVRRFLHHALAFSPFQVHGALVCPQFVLKFHQNQFFPLPCLPLGEVVTGPGVTELSFRVPDQVPAALEYFLDHVYLDAKRLLERFRSAGPGALSPPEKVRLFHRLYSFPFAFLQATGVEVEKKGSFEELAESHGSTFPGVRDFFRETNEFYLNWRAEPQRTYHARSVLSRFLSGWWVNRAFLPFERSLLERVERGFRELASRGSWRRFEVYLDAAFAHLRRSRPDLEDPHRPYLRREFYDRCLEKLASTFGSDRDVEAVYQVGTVRAPGNSDLDLVFVVRPGVSKFDDVVATLAEKFTTNERHVVYQHHPFVLPAQLARGVAHARPVGEPVKVFGADVEFERVEDLDELTYVVVELSAFTQVPRPPDPGVGDAWTYRRPLQAVNAACHFFELYERVARHLEIASSINFSAIAGLKRLNDRVRRSYLSGGVRRVAAHLERAWRFLDSKLWVARLELAARLRQLLLVDWRRRGLDVRLPAVATFGGHYFVRDRKVLVSVTKWRDRLKEPEWAYFSYLPVEFYYFFAAPELLPKNLARGVARRNEYLDQYLDYTTRFNGGRNLYAPFWYGRREEDRFGKAWRKLPRVLRERGFTFVFVRLCLARLLSLAKGGRWRRSLLNPVRRGVCP
ncbi:MAG: hypothetical protein Kow0069_30370 [Promethearchaeota archaeon]